MGNLGAFDVYGLIREYGLDTFIETGTGGGDSLFFALGHGFNHLYSIEIIESLHQAARRRFSEFQQCTLIHDSSERGLPRVLSEIDMDRRILFWLDAHFPGADFGMAGYGDVQGTRLRIPLETELSIIRSMRGSAPDVFIIDDLRIYEDGPFENGNWADRASFGGSGIGFIETLFKGTHQVIKDFRSEGYVVLKPREG